MPIICTVNCYILVTKSQNLVPKSDADLNIVQTAWGDSGVYVCNVVSGQDLTGNNEDYTELIVLGKALGVTDTLLLFSLLCYFLSSVFYTHLCRLQCTQKFFVFFLRNIPNNLVPSKLVPWQVDIQ